MKELIPTDREHIIVSLSGGLDSALLLYLLCEKMQESGLTNKVYVLHNYEHQFTKQVVKCIFQYMKIKFKDIDLQLRLIEFYRDQDGDKNKSNIENYITLIDEIGSGKGYLFLGVTKGIPELDTPEVNEHQKRDRDNNVDPEISRNKGSYNGFEMIFPFIGLNKHDVAKMYSHLQLDEIKNITVSCTTTTNGIPCETCWWCQEKYIGFGHY